jgi:hypothetical protein
MAPTRYPELLALLAAFPTAPGYLELRARHPQHHGIKRLFVPPADTATITRWLAHRGGFTDAFMGVALRDGQGGGKANLVSLPTLWVDIDRDRLELPDDVPAPTAVVASGRGHHVYWALTAATPLDELRVGFVDLLLRGLAQRLGGDLASAETAHVLRVPGTLNAKYRPPVRARLRHLDPTRRTALASFLAYADRAPRPPEPAAAPRRRPPVPDAALDRLFAGCAFLRWARDHQADVNEPLWHAALTNLAPFPGGHGAAQELSERYPRFHPKEFQRKFAHARDDCRPNTCQRIQTLGFTECLGCAVWGHVRAPAGLAYRRSAPVTTAPALRSPAPAR